MAKFRVYVDPEKIGKMIPHDLARHPLTILPRMDLAHMPSGISGYVLTAKGVGVDPSYDPALTAGDVWGYPTRTLTTTQFPFWRAIITQVAGSISIPAGAIGTVDVHPPSGETWLCDFLFSMWLAATGYRKDVWWEDYDGVTVRSHGVVENYNEFASCISTRRVLTYSLYGRMRFKNGYTTTQTAYYGYSGFKLSQPLWSPKRINQNPPPKPWKVSRTKPLPLTIAKLDKYAFDILGINPTKPDDYDLGVFLEEDTLLATDPATNFPVERFTAVVQADVLTDYIDKFKVGTADPATTGYRKYLDKWKAEGIDLGV